MWADVKSEQYETSNKVPESVKFEEALDDVVRGEEDLEGVGPWWEQFPKRWVIVVLCFSAFLLCNMDRVSLLCLFSFCIRNADVVGFKHLINVFFLPNLAGEHEHCYTSNVSRVQLEPRHCGFDSVFFFLGLSPHSGSIILYT